MEQQNNYGGLNVKVFLIIKKQRIWCGFPYEMTLREIFKLFIGENAIIEIGKETLICGTKELADRMIADGESDVFTIPAFLKYFDATMDSKSLDKAPKAGIDVEGMHISEESPNIEIFKPELRAKQIRLSPRKKY